MSDRVVSGAGGAEGCGPDDVCDDERDDDVVGCACRSCVPWRLGDDEDAAERDVVP